jgi:hypothetical protein
MVDGAVSLVEKFQNFERSLKFSNFKLSGASNMVSHITGSLFLLELSMTHVQAGDKKEDHDSSFTLECRPYIHTPLTIRYKNMNRTLYSFYFLRGVS